MTLCRMRFFLERFRQALHQRFQILVQAPGDFMAVDPEFNAGYHVRFMQYSGW